MGRRREASAETKGEGRVREGREARAGCAGRGAHDEGAHAPNEADGDELAVDPAVAVEEDDLQREHGNALDDIGEQTQHAWRYVG